LPMWPRRSGKARDLVCRAIFSFNTLAKTAVIAPAHTGKPATAKGHDCAPQFPVHLMRKDFGLALELEVDHIEAESLNKAQSLTLDRSQQITRSAR
jgi:hypothetical protein